MHKVLGIIILSVIISSCGKKGKLYLPEDSNLAKKEASNGSL